MLPQTNTQLVGTVLLVVYVVGLGLVSLRWLRPSTRAPSSTRAPGLNAPRSHSPTACQLAVRCAILRTLAIATAVFGLIYLTWRWMSSLNLAVWPLALGLVIAETYSSVRCCSV